jgi:FKBP-type peptidyl-prolyl cis-trans isomerase (trigger factor)
MGTMIPRIIEERISALTHNYRIACDRSAMSAEVERELERLGKGASVPGFRKGHAPPAVIRTHYGTKVQASVEDALALDVARKVIAEKGLQPIGRPVIEVDKQAVASNTELTFTLLLEVAPVVVLKPLEFQLQRLRAETPDADSIAKSDLQLRRQLFDKLTEQYDFAVPGDMVQHELDRIKQGYEAEVGEPVDAELAVHLLEIAERRIRLAILFAEIGRIHDVHLMPAEVDALLQQRADADDTNREDVLKYYLDHPMALAELQSPLFENRVVEFLFSQSQIEDVVVTVAELDEAINII